MAGLSKLKLALLLSTLAGLAAGTAAYWFGRDGLAFWLWTAGTVPVIAALLAEIVTKLGKGEVGLDIVAGLSMTAALAFGEPLAGNVVGLMYAGGQFLESFAEGRARREMTALLGRVARTSLRYRDHTLEEVEIERLEPGDRLLIRQGEVIPADGHLASRVSAIDLSALTGESLPARKLQNDFIPSGSTNAGDAFDLTVIRRTAESTYAGIIRLVEEAQHSRAPMVRLADRYAIWFLALTIIIAGAAWWISGDRIRALAVLVVATPCPLILAVPVAVMAGLSRAASLGVLIKSGGALEALARIRTAIIDKTGTLTYGRARITDIRSSEGHSADDILRLAASLDLASHHVMAETLVGAARERSLVLSTPTDVEEIAGAGVSGQVEGKGIVVGGSRYVMSMAPKGDPYVLRGDLPEGAAIVAVAVDGEIVGVIALTDELREDAESVLRHLRAAGVSRIVLASGDGVPAVDHIAAMVHLDEAHANLSPADKVALVHKESARQRPVMMVGDGVNDAPALAAADIGVAMGARGSAASSETADIVLLVDRLDRLAQAVAVAQRARKIALQSVVAGLGMSLAAMLVAAAGYLPPVQGALTQEAIDVAVILNALRALRPAKLS